MLPDILPISCVYIAGVSIIVAIVYNNNVIYFISNVPLQAC